ncbi:protein kinase domain containing protein, partial [Entamoeba invadens IP1]
MCYICCTFLFMLFTLVYSFQCSPGCPDGCITQYTCTGECKTEYDNDRSCNNCRFNNPYLDTSDVYLTNGTDCILSTNKIIKADGSWLPPEKYLTEVFLNKPIKVRIDQNSYIDYGFCSKEKKYNLGQWFKLRADSITTDHFLIVITKENNTNYELISAVTESQRGQRKNCYGYTVMPEEKKYYRHQIPNILRDNITDLKYYYIFIRTKDYAFADFHLEISEQEGRLGRVLREFNQSDITPLAFDLDKKISWDIDFADVAITGAPACIPQINMELAVFEIKFNGNYSVLFDARKQNRICYLQEYIQETDENGAIRTTCVQAWDGKRYGAYKYIDNEGFLVRIKGSDKGKRTFAVMTNDQKALITLEISVVCPNDCNNERGYGSCSTREGKCICEDGYGGDNCHRKCYDKGTWNEDANGKCLFDSLFCDQYCKCEPGTTLKNHLCISSQCTSGHITGDMCKIGSDGCRENCECHAELGFFSDGQGNCKHELCGNGKIDTNPLFTEECDSGTNCNLTCYCEEGYVTDPKDVNSCYKPSISIGEIFGIVFGSIIGFIVVILILIIIIVLLVKTDKVSIETFKQQQPIYYLYINGSSKIEPSKLSKYDLKPTCLNFGNDEKATNVGDTRFERMVIKNRSRNKWMMIIFHVPNCPKYVFHFDPQVFILRPYSSVKTMTAYITIHCTTRIKGMNIP